jgi:hypothetical protein
MYKSPDHSLYLDGQLWKEMKFVLSLSYIHRCVDLEVEIFIWKADAVSISEQVAGEGIGFEVAVERRLKDMQEVGERGRVGRIILCAVLLSTANISLAH